MDCIIKIVSGPEAGREFRCTAGETLVGRSPRCGIQLSSAGVSYEHALVTRKGDEFFLENLSANGTLLNNEKLQAPTRLRPRDQFRMGSETIARVESLPAAASARGSRTWLLGIFAVMLLVLIVVVIADPFSGSSSGNLSRAYDTLLFFTQDEAQQQHLPSQAPAILRDAWRLEAAGDHAEAAKAWLGLHVLLSDSENKTNIQKLSLQYPAALSRLAAADATAVKPTTDELYAALLQFVSRMERAR